MFVKENKDIIIPLYIKSIEELREDLLVVKNDETKTLIKNEIEYFEKRIKFIESL